MTTVYTHLNQPIVDQNNKKKGPAREKKKKEMIETRIYILSCSNERKKTNKYTEKDAAIEGGGGEQTRTKTIILKPFVFENCQVSC